MPETRGRCGVEHALFQPAAAKHIDFLMPRFHGGVVFFQALHENQRGGIALMDAVSGNTVEQNDARGNNLSGLAPCYRCNLVDLSVGGNTWERNLGTFNLTDACAF